ncbi:MAG: trypsin-like peptidase domain-containing protein [Cyclobacteriaceae bacterium]|nr:trypsin-like peptidase domain-containing protein [Cyclobacteriaceae bacterium]
MKSFKIFTVLIFLSNYTHGQIRSIYSDVDKVVSQNGIFHSLEPEQSIFIEINKGDAIKEAEEEENLIGNRLPYKFGKSVDFHHDSENSGTWIDTVGGRVWKLKISSKGAFSLSVIFSKLKLANGAQLYIYNSEGSMLSGPITSTEIPMTGGFKSDIIKGDELILELFEPKEFHGTSMVQISKVVYGFRNIFQPNAFGDSFECNDDVSCESDWDIQSNGVAMVILANMERLCSGSLLNNACDGFNPNILTAFHCIDIGNDINNIDPCNDNELGNGILSAQEIANAEDWIFRFQYKRPICNSGSEPMNFFTFQQATFRAGWFDTDFALVEMTQNPVQNSQPTGIHYLGWSRINNPPTSGAIIGHPRGDVMKIVTFDDPAQNNNEQIAWTLCQFPLRQNFSPINTHWTTMIDNGALQGGISGGPLFDQNRNIVGQIHGGIVGCAPTTGHSGRFDVSWGRDANGNFSQVEMLQIALPHG